MGKIKEPLKPYFLAYALNICLRLLLVFPEAKAPVNSAALYNGVVWWAEEIGRREPLLRRIRHHSVLHASVHVIAPCLPQTMHHL